MNIRNLFNKNQINKQGLDTVVSSKELINEESETSSVQEVDTELIIPDMMNVSTEQQYVLRFLNNELPPLKPNQISLAGIVHRLESGHLIVSAFIRNSLDKEITFNETTILLIGPNGEHLARRVFNLSELGSVPSKSSIPWNFVFRAQDMFGEKEIPAEGWKLAFELNPKHSLDLDRTWEESLPDDEKKKLKDIVDRLQPPKKGEINLLGLQARRNIEAGLEITLLIRNGNDKDVQLEQLPLQVSDASNQVVASGVFKLDDFEVKAHTSKPWTFIFPKDTVENDEIDVSRWRVQVIQN